MIPSAREMRMRILWGVNGNMFVLKNGVSTPLKSFTKYLSIFHSA